MKRLLYFHLLASVVAVADLAHGSVVIEGGGLVLAEQGGTIDSSGLGDLALAGTAFALDEHAAAVHAIVHLNDGIFGNTNSWIGGGSEGTSGPFVGIGLGAATSTVQSIAFGRDSGGEEQEFTDRWGPGVYTLQYTQVANPDASTGDADWANIGTLDYQSAGGAGFELPSLRHRYNFDPVEATGIRLMVASTAVAIDELELYAAAGEIMIQPPASPIALTPEPGFSITWDENEGDFFDEAAPPEQVGAPDNVALATAGAVAFGSSAYPAPAHEIAHANDGYYGNSNSWLADPNDANPFIGIDFAGSDAVAVENIAFGRDNGNNVVECCGGQLRDRWQGLYTLQYTLLPDPNELTADTGDAATGWANIGTIDLIREGWEGGPLQEPWLRHLFDVSLEGGSPIQATGIRILAPTPNAIDEIEVNSVQFVDLTWDVPGHVDLTWEGNGNWTAGGGPPDRHTRTTIPEDNSETITVGTSAAETYSLWVEGGQVAIAAGQKLTVAATADFAQGTTLRLGGGAAFSARQGGVDRLATAGDVTVDVTAGTLIVDQVSNTAAGSFTKQGAGTLSLPAVGGDNPLAGHNPLILGGGVLEISTNSMGGSEVGSPEGLELSGGGLALVEEGGTFDQGNLAAGATPFAFDELGPSLGVDFHLIANLNDLAYGNTFSWIGDADTGTSGPIAGLSLGGTPVTVQSIAFGRDNANSHPEGGPYQDRWAGQYTLQYTQVANPGATTPDEEWTTIGTLDYQVAGGAGFQLPMIRHRYGFDPVEATGIRLIVPATGLSGGTDIDEIELYATAPQGVSFEPLDMSEVDLRVVGDSTLSLTSPAAVSLASLTLEAGILTNLGVEVGFAGGTTIEATPEAVVGVDLQAGLDLGEINVVNPTPVTFVKAGTLDLVLTPASRGSGFENLTIDVQEGRLIGVNQTNPFGAAALQLGGGELMLSSTGGSVSYDNAVAVTENSTLAAGAAGGGAAGPLTVTLGSAPDNGLSIDAQKTLTLQTADEYSLVIAGTVSGSQSTVRVNSGSVTFAAGGSLGTLRVGEGTAVGTSQTLLISDLLRLGTTTLRIDEGNSLTVSGADLLGESDVTLSGGTIQVANGAALAAIDVSPDALALDGGGLILVEEAGEFADGNLAEGATPIALDELAYQGTKHFIEDLNDGLYGNANSWIGGGDTGTSGPFAGISLGGTPVALQSIAFGRSNVTEGDVCGGGVCTDRWPGLYTLQYTQVPNPDATTADEDWTTVGTLEYLAADAEGEGFAEPWRRHRYVFDPIEATGVRLIVPLSGLSGGTDIDEIEIYGRALQPIDMPEANFLVTADSMLQLDTDEDATLGDLTLHDGVTLAIEGAFASFDNVTTGNDSTISGGLLVRGAISPGDGVGTLNVEGEMELDDSASYVAELAGADADLVSATGDIFLAGTLSLRATDKVVTAGGAWGEATRTIMIAADAESVVASTFDSEPVPGDHLGHGVFHQGVVYAGQRLDVEVFQAAPGDTNGNRQIDNADLQAILGAGSFGNPGQWDWTEGDFDGDGDVDNGDLQLILGTGLFGAGSYAAAAAGGNLVAVPEPSTVVLLGVAVFWLLGYACVRRRDGAGRQA